MEGRSLLRVSTPSPSPTCSTTGAQGSGNSISTLGTHTPLGLVLIKLQQSKASGRSWVAESWNGTADPTLPCFTMPAHQSQAVFTGKSKPPPDGTLRLQYRDRTPRNGLWLPAPSCFAAASRSPAAPIPFIRALTVARHRDAPGEITQEHSPLTCQH